MIIMAFEFKKGMQLARIKCLQVEGKKGCGNHFSKKKKLNKDHE